MASPGNPQRRVIRSPSGVTVVVASGVRFVGTAAVNDPTSDGVSTNDNVAAAIASLTDVDSATYSTPELYPSVALVISEDRISVTDLLTTGTLVSAPIVEIASAGYVLASNGRDDADDTPAYFGFITHQHFGAMAVGFVCHVFACDNDHTATTSTSAINRSFLRKFESSSSSSSINTATTPTTRRAHGGKSRAARRAASTEPLDIRRSHSDATLPRSRDSDPLTRKGSGRRRAASITSKAGRLAVPPDNGLAASSRPLSGDFSDTSTENLFAQSGIMVPLRLQSLDSDHGASGGSPRGHSYPHAHSRSQSRGHARGHARTQSRDGDQAPVSPQVSVSPEDEAEPATQDYFVQQTAQNLLRRLAVDPTFALSADHGFTGHEVVTWLLKVGDFTTREHAASFMAALVRADAVNVVGRSSSKFQDSGQLYRFSMAVARHYVAELESGKGSSAEADTTEMDSGDGSDQFDLVKAIAQDSPGAVCAILDQMGELSSGVMSSCMVRSVKRKAVKVVKALIDRGFPVSCRVRNGDTLLHRAAYYGDTPMVKALIEASADVHDTQNADDATPLLRASRLRNLGCAILLMEHGARVQAPARSGLRPVDLLPDLEETQQRLCESVVSSLTSGPIEDLTRLSRLVSNDENDVKVLRLLTQPDAVAAVLGACHARPRVAEQWTHVLETLFTRGPRRRRSADHGILKAIVPAASVPGLLGARARGLCVSMIQDELANNGDGALSSLASVPLDPFLGMVTGTGGAEADAAAALVAARVLAAATRFRPGRKQLAAEGPLQAILQACIALPLDEMPPVPEAPPLIDLGIDEDGIGGGGGGNSGGGGAMAFGGSTLTEHILDILANVLLCPEAHPIFATMGRGVRERLLKLTEHTSEDVRFQATRACVYANYPAVPADCLFDVGYLRKRALIAHTPLQEKPRADPLLHWNGIRGVTLEAFVALVLDVQSPLSLYHLHLARGPHFPSFVMFRCVTAQLRALGPPVDGLAEIPPSHRRVFDLLKLWVEHRLSDFMESPTLLDDLKGLMGGLQARNDLYGSVAGKLLDTAVESGQTGNRPSGVTDYSHAAHHRLYDRAAQLVRSGNLPCPKELAVTLAATSLYIEDLQQSCVGRETKMNSLKRVLPPKMHKDKDIDGLIATEYTRICGLTLRDAKHLYLDTCKLVDFDYFPVKEPVFVEQTRKKTPRLLGIGERNIVLLHEKTKAVVFQVETSVVRSWHLSLLKDKGKDWLTPLGDDADRRLSLMGRGAWYLLIQVGKGGDVLRLTGEVETLRKAIAVLIERSKANRLAASTQPDGKAPDAAAAGSKARVRAGSSPDKFVCNCPPTPQVVDLDRMTVSIAEMLGSPTEVARQLTLMEDTLFRQVSAQSLIEHVLMGKGGDAAPDKFIAHFNRTTRWMVTAVLDQPDRGSRRRCIEQLIRVGWECEKLGNLNGVMECIASLGSTAVQRLAGTWDDVDKDLVLRLERLQTLMGFSNNFSRYRKALSELSAPAIPYLGVVLRDITAAHQGTPNTLASGLMNVSKWRPILDILKSFERLQGRPYNLLILPQVQAQILGAPALDEDELDIKSRGVQDPIKSHRRSLFSGGASSSDMHRKT